MSDQSKRKSFDAIRTILDYSPYTIDSFYAKLEENTVNLADDMDVMGINASYDWSSYNGVSELYVMRMETTLGLESGTDTAGGDELLPQGALEPSGGVGQYRFVAGGGPLFSDQCRISV